MALIRGTTDNDRLIGSPGKDRIVADLGDDWIAGRDGNDRLTGDTGNPNDYRVGFDDFVFDRHDGTDTITDFQTACPACILLLLDATEADIDAVVAGVTADGKGNATLHYGETDIVLAGMAPADVSDGWFISAKREIDLPILKGTNCPDRLVGTAGDERLLGLKGNDRIIARDGDDVMTGGEGADRYVFDRRDGMDTITDFTPWGRPPECEESEVCIAIAVALDRIVLKGGTQADIEAAVAGATGDGEGNAVIRYGETDIVLAGIKPTSWQGSSQVMWRLTGSCSAKAASRRTSAAAPDPVSPLPSRP